jgi:diguanylate cyclase (GGDEF)-like protein
MTAAATQPDEYAGRSVQVRCAGSAGDRHAASARPDARWQRLAAAALALVLTLGPAPARASDEAEARGLPPVTVVPPSALGTPQLFAIAAVGARIYVGTLGGVSVFDGAHWESAPSPRAVYALAVSSRGRVVGGGPDTLLELRQGGDGRRTLVSLLPVNAGSDPGIGDVRSILAFDETFLVVTDRRLLQVRGSRVRTVVEWSPDAGRRAFASRGLLYVVSQGGAEAFTPDGERRHDGVTVGAPVHGPVTVVADGPGDTQLVAVDGAGIFTVRDGEWVGPQAASMSLLQQGVTDLRRLAGDAVAVSTSTSGVVLLTPTLEIDRVLSRAEGLPAPQVDALAEDAERGLWTLGPSSLARLDLGGPLSLIDARMGLEGTVNGVVRHQGRVYVLTSAGLFVLDREAGRMHAFRVPGVPSRAWDGLDLGDQLLVATASGVVQLDAAGIRVVPGTAHLSAYVLRQRVDRSDVVLVGTRTGLSLLRRDGVDWRFERDVPDAPRYSRSIVSRPGGVVYIGSVFDGIVRIGLDAPAPRLLRIGEGEVHLRDIGGALHVLTSNPPTLSVVDEGRGDLRPVEALSMPAGAVRFVTDRAKTLWVVGRGVVRYDPPQRVPRTVLDGSLSVQAVEADADGIVWLGGSGGLWRFAADMAAPELTRPSPTLERLSVNGRPVAMTTADGLPPALPFGIERLRLEFSPNTFAAAAVTEFRLDPIDAEWSGDRQGPVAEYTSLPEGDYRLRFRTTDAADQAEREWRFTVRPPWHRTPLVQALQVALLVVVGLVLVRWRTDALRRRSRELEHAVVDQHAALQEANHRLTEMASRDQLTGLFNRRHFERTLAQEWARAHRQRRPIALVMVDIDHFKALNDSLGHVAGDEALRAVASVIAQCARRAGDIAARFGGEEFVVLLPGAHDGYLYDLAEEIRGAVEALELHHPATPLQRVTVSVGVAAVMVPTSLEPTLVAAADRALYRAKAAGRNGVAA